MRILFSLFKMLCRLGSIGIDNVLSELCYKGIILQRNYRKMTQILIFQMRFSPINSLPSIDIFCLLLIIYANSLDTCRSGLIKCQKLFDTVMVFLIDFSFKGYFENISRQKKKTCKEIFT